MWGGLVILAHWKEVVISLPDSVIQEMDSIARKTALSREKVAEHAVRMYLREKKRREQEMRRGYEDMADYNLETAELCLKADNELLQWYEEKLAESE